MTDIVERLKEYVSRSKIDGSEPIFEKGHFADTNSFASDMLDDMFQEASDYDRMVKNSGRGSYPEDLLALMPEEEIPEAYARWCIEEENHESS